MVQVKLKRKSEAKNKIGGGGLETDAKAKIYAYSSVLKCGSSTRASPPNYVFIFVYLMTVSFSHYVAPSGSTIDE